ncbi:MAG: hypothetical protein ACYSUV_21040, partial [Planctomycetota bacterium]
NGDTVQVNGMWFQVVKGKGTISMISREYGRFTGHVVNTMAGTMVLFSHNGRRYQNADARVAFEQMMARESSRLRREVR